LLHAHVWIGNIPEGEAAMPIHSSLRRLAGWGRACSLLAAATVACAGMFVAVAAAPAGASAPTNVTGVSVSLSGASANADARSAYSVSFSASATGGLSAAAGSDWTVSFPTGTNLCNLTYLSVTDVTTGQSVGGGGCVGGGNPSTISGRFYSGVVVSPGDTLRVDLGGAYNPPRPGSYTVQAWTSSDTLPTTSSNNFMLTSGTSPASASVTLNGITAATGARSGYSVGFTTSATGGMSAADGSSWTISFPTGTNLCNLTYLSVTDATTNQGVGGGNCIGGGSPNVISGGFYSGVVISAGDALRVDIGGAYNAPYPGSAYTVNVATTSDTVAVTSSNSYSLVAAGSPASVSVSLNGVTAATGARSGYSVSFTTSATGGMSSADGSTWTVSFPTGTNLCNMTYLSVTDVTTNQGVGGGNCIGGGSPNVISGGFYSGVVIDPGDSLRVDLGGAYNVAYAGTSYTVDVSTSSDPVATTSSNAFTVVTGNPISNVAVSLTGVSSAAGARSGYSVSFTTSATGGMSSADGSSWTISFPTGTNLCNLTYLSVTDVTAHQGVGNGGCAGGGSPNVISGGFYSGVAIAPGDSLRVDMGGAYNTAYAGTYTVQASTSSDPVAVTSTDDFTLSGASSLTGASVSLNGASGAAGARSGYSVTFTTSATGGLSAANGSNWTISFPSGTNLCSLTYLSVTDTTTNQGVGGGGCAGGGSANVISGGFNSGVDIHAGDTLRVDIGGAYNVSAPGAYTVAVSTSSDPAAVTASNSFTIVAAQAVSNPQVSVDNSGAGTAGANYSLSFTTSSTGQLSTADGSSWSLTFPSGSNFCNLRYLSVTDVTTGQGVGGGGCAGGGSPNVVSGGFNGGVDIHAGDTLRVDIGGATNPPSVGAQTVTVTTSSDKISAQGTYETTATTTASGTVVDGNGTPVVGSSVQACPQSGPCQVGTTTSGGSFNIFGLRAGSYTVIAYPPAGASGQASSPAEITVNFPNPVTGINLQLIATTVMPAGATLTSGGNTASGGSVPTVNWGNPITYSVSGCKGGFGLLRVSAVNTSTGQTESQFAPLAETPAGSGNYTAQLPALAPLHGTGNVSETITCPGHTEVLPADGSPQGGTSVLLTGSGFKGATAVKFGAQAATSFQVLSDDAILAVSPAGNGAVAVVVTETAGPVTVGTFTYMGVTGLSTSSGGSSGGTTVTITGEGFDNMRAVAFGNAFIPRSQIPPADISDTQITVTAPPQFGSDSSTVDVQVIGDFGVSQPTPADKYTYTGPPPPMTNGEVCAQQPDLPACQLATWLGNGATIAGGILAVLSAPGAAAALGAAKSAVLDTLLDGLIAVTDDGLIADLGIGALAAIEGTALLPLAGLILAGIGIGILVWSLLIDPSGTVLDTSGNPISGSDATILKQSATGAFDAVPALSGEIDPSVNPETTGKSGEFHWDAVAGTYEVQATAQGCHAPGSLSQPAAITSPFELPPPAVGLVITLDCPPAKPPVPVITSLNPATGPTIGGTLVQITGSGLGAATTVHFGSVQATSVTVLSPYAVDAVAPPGSSTVDVTVTTPGGSSAAGAGDKYTYTQTKVAVDAPTITSISPSSGPISGGTQVTVTGTNLSEIFGADFGTVAASVKNVSSTEVVLTAPAALVSGPVDISLTSANGTSGFVSGDVFVYGQPPGATPPPTTVAVSSSANPSILGKPVKFVAAIGPTDGGGTVSFFADGSSSPITGCLAIPLSLVGNRFEASCSTPTFSPGVHKILVSYSGDSGSSASSATISQTVERESSASTLSLSTGSLVYGKEQTEKLAVSVGPSATRVPTGKVTIKSGSMAVCIITLSAGKGACTLSPAALPAGKLSLVALYAGDTNFGPSQSSPRTLTVAKERTSITLTLSRARVNFGSEQLERFAVRVAAPYSGTPSGTVTISTGKAVLCKVILSRGSGTCSSSAKALRVGTYKVIATYPASGDFVGVVSAGKLLTVAA
jgi:hypothetical protein